MRRSGWLAVVVLGLVLAFRSSTASQDNYEGRIASLETRVSVLEVAGGGPVAVPGRSLYGVVVIHGSAYGRVAIGDAGCFGGQDYADVAPGSVVSATDERGVTVGTGTLGAGVAPSTTRPDGGIKVFVQCAMPFAISGVVEAEGYRIEYGDGRFVDVPWSEIESGNWSIQIDVD